MFGRHFHEQFLENIKPPPQFAFCGGVLIHFYEENKIVLMCRCFNVPELFYEIRQHFGTLSSYGGGPDGKPA